MELLSKSQNVLWVYIKVVRLHESYFWKHVLDLTVICGFLEDVLKAVFFFKKNNNNKKKKKKKHKKNTYTGYNF